MALEIIPLNFCAQIFFARGAGGQLQCLKLWPPRPLLREKRGELSRLTCEGSTKQISQVLSSKDTNRRILAKPCNPSSIDPATQSLLQ